MPSVVVVPAAGKGERFGGAKLLARIEGIMLIDRTLGSLLEGGVDRAILVVAPGADFATSRRLADPRVQVIVNPDPSRGMFSSIRAGLAVADGDPMLVMPADMPFVSVSTVAAVLAACARTPGIVAPVHEGRRGHPVAFPASMRAAILREPPESTLKAALIATSATWLEVQVRDPGIHRDVDAPGDLK
jgi:molybdenum cofactor cytidylyltransferase